MNKILIGQSLQEKIIKESLYFPGKIALLTYYIKSIIEKKGSKIDCGPGFILEFISETDILHDFTMKSYLTKISICKDIQCIVHISKEIISNNFVIEIIDGKIQISDQTS